MTVYHHLYPFSPWGVHGGTQRLRTAIDASQTRGTAILSWWDAERLVWRTDVPIENVGTPDLELAQVVGSGLKRRIFPSTLWEAGRKSMAEIGDTLAQHADASVVLHTTLLAPLAKRLDRSGRQIVIDVHDVVFRGHRDDANRGSLAARIVRRAYAGSVRRRELRALAPAQQLAVAGWGDSALLNGLGLDQARWAPVGLEAELSAMPEVAQLCVGLLGNFHHSPTAIAAAELIASPLGRDPAVEIVLAGIGSERYQRAGQVRSLGQIATTGEFYDQVHATVVPVMNGTGMKCKLGEAALAGKAVITTRLGAMGYPPDLQDAFVLVDGPRALTRDVAERAVEQISPKQIRARFEPIVGRAAAAATYAGILERGDAQGAKRRQGRHPSLPKIGEADRVA